MTPSYNAVTSACRKGGQWQRALELLEGMSQRALTPNVISYNAATSACEKGGQWQRALELLEGMPQRALKPDVISYSAALACCVQGGRPGHASAVLDVLLLDAFPNAEEELLRPNVGTLLLDAEWSKHHARHRGRRALLRDLAEEEAVYAERRATAVGGESSRASSGAEERTKLEMTKLEMTKLEVGDERGPRAPTLGSASYAQSFFRERLLALESSCAAAGRRPTMEGGAPLPPPSGAPSPGVLGAGGALGVPSERGGSGPPPVELMRCGGDAVEVVRRLTELLAERRGSWLKVAGGSKGAALAAAAARDEDWAPGKRRDNTPYRPAE